VDADQRYVYSNPAACHLLGFSSEQLQGQDFLFAFEGREYATMQARLPTEA
jgi:PAS domain S-box-containing protein